jgi:hypothetical protein
MPIHHQLKAIFTSALEFGSAEARSGYLAIVCGEDADLRTEVESLLTVYDLSIPSRTARQHPAPDPATVFRTDPPKPPRHPRPQAEPRSPD